ncbi:MAG TPA: hypothetical protein VFZ23_05320 [Pyrinomonadaceae bacterium]
MKRISNLLTAVSAVALIVLAVAGSADAQRRNDRQIRDTVRSLNAQIDDFQFSLDNYLQGAGTRQEIEEMHERVRNLQVKVDEFEENLNNRRENRDDVREIIAAAKDVDAFLALNPRNRRIDTGWERVRSTIDSLAQNYVVTPDWNAQGTVIQRSTRDRSGGRVYEQDEVGAITSTARVVRPGVPQRSTTMPGRGMARSSLTGTYSLDRARSENTADIISGTSVTAGNRADLESKLDAPEQISIDVRGNEITLGSSKAPAITFIADGREKTEQSNGRTIRVRATLRGEELTVSSLGGETDYTVTFTPMDNGRSLKVTRRITTDYLTETVFAESFYTRTDAYAGAGIDRNSGSGNDVYSSSDPNDRYGTNNDPSILQNRTGEFIVPNGTIITGLLDSSIDTQVTQNNDRFRMIVQSPDEFRGATIEGYLTGVGRSGQISGRSNVTFNFESITLRNGKRYDFAGSLQSVKDQFGKDVRVDTEGVAKGESQTKETAKRGGIGAGLGAIIGAIAGGAKGAAIGAIIGGGAGAGSVVVQGRDDLQLMKGSIITVQSSSPTPSAGPVPSRDN